MNARLPEVSSTPPWYLTLAVIALGKLGFVHLGLAWVYSRLADGTPLLVGAALAMALFAVLDIACAVGIWTGNSGARTGILGYVALVALAVTGSLAPTADSVQGLAQLCASAFTTTMPIVAAAWWVLFRLQGSQAHFGVVANTVDAD